MHSVTCCYTLNDESIHVNLLFQVQLHHAWMATAGKDAELRRLVETVV